MNGQPQTPTAPQASAPRLLDDMSALLRQAELLLGDVAGGEAVTASPELATLVRRIQSAADQLRLSLRPDDFPRDPRATFGVAFAAGSVSPQTWRVIWGASLGWAFGAGLLLGLLLRRR